MKLIITLVAVSFALVGCRTGMGMNSTELDQPAYHDYQGTIPQTDR